MTTKVTCSIAILAFLGVVSLACADSCAPSIARVQAQVDAALDSLERARAADRVGDVAVCRHELASARAILRQQRQQ
jgi:hypothetical protein